MKDVRLLQSGFAPDALIASFTRDHPGLGGVCSFVGQVRSGAGGDVEWLELSHYEPLTLSAMNELADNAHRANRVWPFVDKIANKNQLILRRRSKLVEQVFKLV